jgi:hypothetical protein
MVFLWPGAPGEGDVKPDVAPEVVGDLTVGWSIDSVVGDSLSSVVMTDIGWTGCAVSGMSAEIPNPCPASH